LSSDFDIAEGESFGEWLYKAKDLLARGRAILDPLLLAHGFVFEAGESDVGSGGPFARGAYVRGEHRLAFSVRWHLGEVTYTVGPSRISHEELMRVVAGPRAAKYPGFSNDPLDGFRDLRDDLQAHGQAFLREMDEEFHAFVARASRSQRATGFKRLSDVDAG
jgi:hypothetical protein